MGKYKKIIIILIVIICFLYLKMNSTYTSYESEVNGSVDSAIANWNIKVNDTLITDAVMESIPINTIEWNSTHIREGKAAPGSSGVITLTIDPTTTDVSFDYELTIIDNSVDEKKLLTVTSVTTSFGNLEKNNNSYYGSMKLENIKKGQVIIISISVLWDDHGQDTVVVPSDDVGSDDFIDIDFRAIQKK